MPFPNVVAWPRRKRRPGEPSYAVQDLLNGPRYTWRADGWNYVELDPAVTPAHVLQVARRLRPEAGDGG